MNGQGGNTAILQPFSQLYNYPVIIIPPQPCLYSYRKVNGFYNGRSNFKHFGYIA